MVMRVEMRKTQMKVRDLGTFRDVPFGAWLVFVAFGLTFSIILNTLLGGSITRIVVILFGVLVMKSRTSATSLVSALERTVHDNAGSLSLLLIYYLWIVVGCIRVGSFTTSFGEDAVYIWKYHLNEWIALFLGFLLLHNPTYRRWAIYVAGMFMLSHAFFSLKYVASTGLDIRAAMIDTAGALGVSSFWQEFAMGAILLLGYLLSETRKWVKIVGFCCLLVLYRTILFCGFATPVALFLIGHAVLGLVVLVYGAKSTYRTFIKLIIPAIFIVGAYFTVVKLAGHEGDDRTTNIQFRFKNMLENPEGGGYDVENSRLQWMSVGWESFKESPILGAGGMYLMNPASAGHHAAVDYLGVYGLIGGGSYILFVLLCIRNTVRRYRMDKSWESAAAVGVAVMYLGGGIFNPCWYGETTIIYFFYVFPFRRGNE